MEKLDCFNRTFMELKYDNITETLTTFSKF